MFNTPANTPPAVEAATRLERDFLALVADLVGEPDSHPTGSRVVTNFD